MNIKNSYRNLLKLTVCLSFFAVTSAYSSNYHQETPIKEASIKNESIEKIEVLGKRPVSYFKREMFRAQKLFLTNYNNLTTENKFKTKCYYYMPLATRLRKRICEARFVQNKRAEMTRDQRYNGGARVSKTSLEVELRDTRKEYQQDMINVVLANPELRKQLSAYAATVELYQQKREESFDRTYD